MIYKLKGAIRDYCSNNTSSRNNRRGGSTIETTYAYFKCSDGEEVDNSTMISC